MALYKCAFKFDFSFKNLELCDVSSVGVKDAVDLVSLSLPLVDGRVDVAFTLHRAVVQQSTRDSNAVVCIRQTIYTS